MTTTETLYIYNEMIIALLFLSRDTFFFILEYEVIFMGPWCYNQKMFLYQVLRASLRYAFKYSMTLSFYKRRR